jgi:hypothetical protein
MYLHDTTASGTNQPSSIVRDPKFNIHILVPRGQVYAGTLANARISVIALPEVVAMLSNL